MSLDGLHRDSNNVLDGETEEERIKTQSAASFKAHLGQFKHTADSPRKDKSINTTTTKYIPRNTRKRKSEDDETPKPESSSPLLKKRRQSSKYAPPSKYAHLQPLTDILEPNLICVFVGFNPGVQTATSGHAYAHPSNMFWKLLHSSGCTATRLKPEQDIDLPRLYGMGNTNIVSRPSKDAAELSKTEMAAGTPILEEKLRRYRPEAVCIVGKGIWEAIWRWRYGRGLKKGEFKYGWQEEKDRLGKMEGWAGAEVFVATATSGLAANLKPPEKEAIWLPFGQWVKRRREERAEVVRIETLEE